MSELTFTARQRQVVELIAGGYSNQEIGDALGISERTVRAHCEVVRRKLGDIPRRQIPLAYRRATGADPLAWSESAPHEGSPAPFQRRFGSLRDHRFVI